MRHQRILYCLAFRSPSPVSACRRYLSTASKIGTYLEPCTAELPADFRFFPGFLNGIEQRTLLLSALRKLDKIDSLETRRRRKDKVMYDAESSTLSELFLPDEYYDFEEGHYDGVIMHFRETHVTSWSSHSSLESILLRLRLLFPTNLRGDIQTHILHLASNGRILPHVDNIDASGSWIAAISLGGERVLRMESNTVSGKSFDILLPSGSAYVQRNTVRYSYKHSILPGGGIFKGRNVPCAQRLSVILRDRLQTSDGH